MKLLPVLIALPVFIAFSSPASAAKKKRHHHHAAPTPAGATVPAPTNEETEPPPESGQHDKATAPVPEEAPVPTQGAPAPKSPALDFDFFGGQSGAAGENKAGAGGGDSDLAAQAHTRRWMLQTHQILGIATWLSMAATVTVGQLNYNQLYGGGGGKNTWQTPHRALVISTSALFAATGAFALFAPTPYKKPLHFDTGLVHRMAVIGATLGMVTEGVLGWITTHQGDAGNPHNLKTMAQTHQIVGYATLGFLTIAGTVWLF